MVDMEKVIKGLECIAGIGECDCKNCVYSANGEPSKFYRCQQSFARDAIELLKEQKPSSRVLTLEELQKAPSGSLLWIEWKSAAGSPMYPVEFLSIYSLTFPDGVTEKVIEFSNGMDYEDMYGKQFRLWTAKPTDEQRKAVKWDEVD